MNSGPAPENIAPRSARAPLSKRGERTRDRILQAALAVFERRGLAESTMQEIGNEAGMSSGTVYKYFADKAEVFGFLLAKLRAQLRDETSLPLEEGRLVVRPAVLRFLSLYREHAALYRVWWECLEPPSAFSDAWHEMHTSYRDGFAAALRHGKRNGVTVRDLDIPLTAELAVILFERPSFTRLILGWDEDVTDDQYAGLLEGLLGTGIKAGIAEI